MKIILVIMMLAVMTPAQQVVTSKPEGKPGLEKHEGKAEKPKPDKQTVKKPVKK